MKLQSSLSVVAASLCFLRGAAAATDAQITLAPGPSQLATEDAAVVSHYQSLFDHWNPGSDRRPPPTWVCCHCPTCPKCCYLAILKIPSSTIEFSDNMSASVDAVPTNLGNIDQANDPKISIAASRQVFPVTAISMPTRTTIYRHPVQTKGPRGSGADITQEYYETSIQGDHPDVISLIVENAKKEPVTLLSVGDFSILPNFISSSLVEQLDLSHAIDVSGRASQAVKQYCGSESLSLGSLKLNFIAGREDKHFSNITFNVFESPHEPDNVWRVDLVLGFEFLRTAQALKLSDEYTGTGARKGLGVVVQRVFVPKIDGNENKNQSVTHAVVADTVRKVNPQAMIMHKEL